MREIREGGSFGFGTGKLRQEVALKELVSLNTVEE
jgi:hypothetical protein